MYSYYPSRTIPVDLVNQFKRFSEPSFAMSPPSALRCVNPSSYHTRYRAEAFAPAAASSSAHPPSRKTPPNPKHNPTKRFIRANDFECDVATHASRRAGARVCVFIHCARARAVGTHTFLPGQLRESAARVSSVTHAHSHAAAHNEALFYRFCQHSRSRWCVATMCSHAAHTHFGLRLSLGRRIGD